MADLELNNTFLRAGINETNNFSDLQELSVDDLLYDVPVGIVVLLSIFYGTISILAVIGNGLVIWIVATTRQMQTVTNFFIANLAFADVIIGMFAIPFQFQAALLQRWNLPEFMCGFCPFVQLLSVNVSVLTLTAIAVDRHRAILNPLRARQSKNICRLIIACIWVFSILLAAPVSYTMEVIQVKEIIKREGDIIVLTKPFCNNENLTDDQMKIYRYILVLVQYLIPFCVISFVYIQMAVRLWGSKTPGNAQNDRDITLLKNKKKVIKMLLIVVALFGVCWLPLQLYNILQATWPGINDYRYINIIFFCSDWIAMSNSSYNPFIYGIYNEKFKREFSKRCPLCRLGADNSDFSEKSVYTRVSSIRSNYTNTSTRQKIQNHSLVTPNNLIVCHVEGKKAHHRGAVEWKAVKNCIFGDRERTNYSPGNIKQGECTNCGSKIGQFNDILYHDSLTPTKKQNNTSDTELFTFSSPTVSHEEGLEGGDDSRHARQGITSGILFEDIDL
ncbi:prolactin-releasing peptide receptor [Sergentomyia squamirostris]